MKVKNRQEIEIDFSRAMNQAQEIEELAAHMTQMAMEHTDGTMKLIGSSFMGDNGKLFSQKADFARRDMFDTADDLMSLAKTIRQTADIVYRTEKSAIGMFS